MITIIDYKSGNIRSISNGFKKIGAEVELTSDPEKISNAKYLVLPGVGSFGSAMENINPFKDGLICVVIIFSESILFVELVWNSFISTKFLSLKK